MSTHMNENMKTKVAEVESLRKTFTGAKAIIFANYRGITSNDMNELRKQLRVGKSETRVAKLNLMRKAAEGMPAYVEATKDMTGPTLMIVAQDPANAAKVAWEYYKKNEVFEIKNAVLESSVLSTKQVEALSKLPSREVLLAQVLGTLNAPIQSFVGVLAAIPRQFLYALNAVKEQKEKQA